ncbi:uncharacterized protein LOC115620978 [Scaptodrosophila lebanonensis]|uniref:Uncharacterized protein LOC115620978 n=1 Tax=Drosophila lebanonensis TaxID=7225 RepID=A0A6J2T0E7_DROLE|nr:uncharacterized protein LOC115620978 [Scaptodrosophila lebanonensis]
MFRIDIQKISMSIFHTLMGALLDYMLVLLRTIANMSTSITPTRLQAEGFWRQKKMPEPEPSHLLQERKGDENILFNSLQLMADVVVQTAWNQCAPNAITMKGIDLDQMDLCSEPTFCSFFVNINPRARNRFICSKDEFSSSPKSNDSNNNADELLGCSTAADHETMFYEGFKKPMIQYQRSISESSEDSFICFEDNCNEDNCYEGETDEEDIDDDAGINACDCTVGLKKKVRFNLEPKIHVMYTWDYAYRAARKGDWQVHARDRARFQQRIQRISTILDPILCSDHRQKIYKDRCLNVK